MQEMTQSPLSGFLRMLSRKEALRVRTLKLALRLEGGEFYSRTARWMMKCHYGVTIGDYSYGNCFNVADFPKGVTIGRYVSVGPDVRVFRRNHPADRLSLHPIFYNSALGFVSSDTIGSSLLEIGHDAWIGANAVILPGCTQIGIGAVIGAGAIVTKNIPNFGIAVGNPARVLRTRFSEEICERILMSRWWEHSATECIEHMPHMVVPLNNVLTSHPLLKSVR